MSMKCVDLTNHVNVCTELRKQDQQREVDKSKVLFGMSLGPADVKDDEDDAFGTRVVQARRKVMNCDSLQEKFCAQYVDRSSLQLKRSRTLGRSV